MKILLSCYFGSDELHLKLLILIIVARSLFIVLGEDFVISGIKVWIAHRVTLLQLTHDTATDTPPSRPHVTMFAPCQHQHNCHTGAGGISRNDLVSKMAPSFQFKIFITLGLRLIVVVVVVVVVY